MMNENNVVWWNKYPFPIGSFSCSIDCLIGRSKNQSNNWLIDWLIDWLFDGLFGWSFRWVMDWLIDLLFFINKEIRKDLTAPPGWPDTGDVIVYREALGHPLLYIGGLDRFRLYLNQSYQFVSSLMPDSLIAGYIEDNRAELQRADELRHKPPDPEDIWRVSIIATNHLEIVPLQLIAAFGSQSVLGGGKRVELMVHNSSAASGRFK